MKQVYGQGNCLKRNVKKSFQGGTDRGDSLIFYERAQRPIVSGCEVFLTTFVATAE